MNGIIGVLQVKMDHLHSDDIIYGVRQRRKQTDPISCPVCGVTVRPADMEHHYAIEVDRLHKLQSPANRTAHKRVSCTQPKEPVVASTSSAPLVANSGSVGQACGEAGSSSASEVIDPKECWSTYQRIKNNRQARLKTKSRKRKISDPACPVCNETTSEDINTHVELCLRRNEGPSGDGHLNKSHAGTTDSDEDMSIDVGADSFSEYEWAGQTRIRASSLLLGGYGATGLGTTIQNSCPGDEDEDLNVDGDDAQIYGDSQYSELDVITLSAATTKEHSVNQYLRQLVAGEDMHTTSGEPDTRIETSLPQPATATSGNRSSSSPNNDHHHRLSHDSKDQIIASLKSRIHDIEQQRKNKSVCLICMDEFRVPVVSICCWHVHCEECWLHTLGARKLCPQCNMITSPADLRKIYL